MAITHNIISINIFIFFILNNSLCITYITIFFLTMLQIAKLPSC